MKMMYLYSLLYSVTLHHLLILLSSLISHYHPNVSSFQRVMAAAVNFSGQAPWLHMSSKAGARHPRGILPCKETYQLKNNSLRTLQHGLHVGRKAESRLIVMSANGHSIFNSNSSSPSDTINKFYTGINEKNLKKLSECIAEDCYIEDCSFPQPFHGKQEIMHFFDQLIESMGQNVKFSIGHICEGDELTAAVKWHLEWKQSQIPFTRGCSFFECSKQEETIIIEKAQVVIESPIKPGFLVLILFKTVTSLFDDFPRITEWFLKSPHVIFRLIMKIYNMLVAPFVNPILTGYIQIWNFATRFLLFTFNILRYISKIFFK